MTKKILIVEDNEMNRDMLSRRLMRKGYEILIAVDGAIGLEMMKSERPDLVLMDMGLPVMDGWTATANAKADSDLRNIPIIALTAHALEADRLRALEAGADDFDTKIISPSKKELIDNETISMLSESDLLSAGESNSLP